MRRSSHESRSSARTSTNQDPPAVFESAIALIDSVTAQIRDEARAESLQGTLRRSTRPPLPQDWRQTSQTTKKPNLQTQLSYSSGFNTFSRISKATPKKHYQMMRLTDAEIDERYGEDGHKKKLHHSLNELSSTLENWVKRINCLAYDLPEHLMELGNKKGVDLLAPKNGIDHIVLRMSKQLLGIIPMMEPFFDGFRDVFVKWDSNSPNLSDAILSTVDRLRCIIPFGNNSETFHEEFQNRREVDKRFNKAVAMFEGYSFKKVKKGEKPPPAPTATESKIFEVVLTLSRVKLPMENYLKYLEAESEEKEKAERAVEKVKEIVDICNSRCETVRLEDLKVMQKHFKGYDVFASNRRIVYRNNATVKLGGKSSFRYAVLFNDCLWLLSSKRGTEFELRRDIQDAEQFLIGDLDIKNCGSDKNYLRIVTKEKSITIRFQQLECHEKYFEYMERAHENIGEHRIRIAESRAKHDSTIREIRRASTIATTYNQNATFDDSSLQTPSELGFKDFVWTAEFRSDLASDFCMMEDCNTKLGEGVKKRRCMSCGWFMCKKCSGEAPVEAHDFQRESVCSDCFNNIKMRYHNSLLFPEHHPSSSSRVQLGSEETEDTQLFKKPINSNMKKSEAKEHMTTSIVSGSAKVKNNKMKSIILQKKKAGFVVFRPADKWLGFFEKESSEHGIGGWQLKSKEFKEIQHKDGVMFEFQEEMAIRLKVPHADSEKWRIVFGWNFTKV